VRLNPQNVRTRLGLAAALARLGKADQARAEYRAAVALDPKWPARQGRSAWALATHPDPHKRDPARAVALAEQACLATDHGRAPLLDALAAAYASAGRFDDAVATARRALTLAESARQTALATALAQRLRLYQDHRPFREPAPPK
jgi:Flp pilus assembly protein TadD